jgi:hypothetical protein
MAEGKHWEFWLEKCKRREVAQARGESALEEMSLFPESLEDA